MKISGSLQRRLGYALALAVAAMWLLATTWAAFFLNHELDEVFDNSLRETAMGLVALAKGDTITSGPPQAPEDGGALAASDAYLSYVVTDRSGRVVLRSLGADPAVFAVEPFSGFRKTATHHLYGAESADGRVFVQVAEPLGHRLEETAEAAVVLFYPLLILLPLSLLSVWWFVRRSLRPLRHFSNDIEARSASDLSPLRAQEVPRELAPLASAMDRLLARMQRALEAERSFTANSAHELRTPIAAALAQTQRLLAEAPQGELQERARRIESTLRTLAQLSEKLMQLAKAESGGLLTGEPQELTPILDHVVDDFRRHRAPLHAEKREGASLLSRMDADAFAILLRNLIENALKHGDPGTPVYVDVLGAGVVSVTNSGPVVPAAILARLKGRFERGATVAEGSGLGLAIADAIATAGGGSLLLLSPARSREGGFEALLHLHAPLAAAPRP